jgi:hypothetical protein
MEKVNLVDKLALFSDYWKPKIVGELNGQQIKLVKFQGPFVWHHHEKEDELFLVVKGRFRMESRDRRSWDRQSPDWQPSRGQSGDWRTWNSWSCLVASNTGPWLRKKPTSFCSSRSRR